MNISTIQEEARKALIYFGNRVLYSGALGKKDYPSLIKDQERLNYLYGVIANLNSLTTTIAVLNYGSLYNWYAVTNTSPICAANAHVPSKTEIDALIPYIIDSDSGFKFGGLRNDSGLYVSLGVSGFFWTNTEDELLTTSGWVLALYSISDCRYSSSGKMTGLSVRLIVDTPIEIDGTHAIYVGNDGMRYNCVLINSVWWTAENSVETKYRDGSTIPIVTDNTAWAALTTGAMCTYDNDEANAYSLIVTSFIGSNEVDLSFISKTIEMIRHYQCRATDLSAIGAEYTPSTPPSGIASDLLRAGSKIVSAGANSITFSSPLISSDYTINAWVRGLIPGVKYGYLYNWAAANNDLNIASVGWRLPTETDFNTLRSYLGSSYIEGGNKLAKIGAWYNAGDISNSSGFNGVPSQYRDGTGGFWNSETDNRAYFWTSTPDYDNYIHVLKLNNDNDGGVGAYPSPSMISPLGLSIRLVKETTELTNGQVGTYTGNDGLLYPTICIGTQEWVSCNLAETKYRDGSLIPIVTDNTAWLGLSTGAMCAYANDNTNVIESGTVESGESQADLGIVTKSAGGFTVSDVIINGKLYYQAILNI